ncbi:exodeoxyribonuclease III [Leucobacter sp. OLJS4]|uniref:exodeoxyribonuclease III n=1 Tax=unclassified Leucobacter TaxID=2621730 RepID=UPI000C1A0748|nr:MULTISPECIES: exodeoxyribonuclease III [unclassified Leucobacter]PIJ54628.1 exodeoxyribonuclease III [Leucobacter sp. OLES1]PII86663.1 exodeoxyribonuclease III [Leucobacter sp. OLCALW19]PII88971.1 exodeoxyribonuclease III [Leucobacter sp. OLAS13]PII96060.1 exodeoxyribonuclease III [Leucobacter sp. OLTLW20]PII99334.1 exodeoxyribonuclease III [Leucobacter sp. OLDS2]
MTQTLRVASVNVNGVRAAFRKGMGDWLTSRGVDVLAMQEVRADDSHLAELFGDEWQILHDPCNIKGRAGVAIASRVPAVAHRVGLGSAEDQEQIQSSGRWIEADFEVGGELVTVISNYTHSGEVDTPRQEAKWAFLDAMGVRLDQLAAERELVTIVGDFNVGHREFDIKNWKGNVKRSGFLPRERAYFDRFFGPRGETVVGVDGSEGVGHGWIDVGRRWAGEVDGPYSWWSNRGQAFDNDTGWRIDYHVVTPQLGERVENYVIDRAASYDERWSDHAPVVVDYRVGA